MTGSGGRNAMTVIATPSVSTAVSMTVRRFMYFDITA